jgi:hypothetical protein
MKRFIDVDVHGVNALIFKSCRFCLTERNCSQSEAEAPLGLLKVIH